MEHFRDYCWTDWGNLSSEVIAKHLYLPFLSYREFQEASHSYKQRTSNDRDLREASKIRRLNEQMAFVSDINGHYRNEDILKITF